MWLKEGEVSGAGRKRRGRDLDMATHWEQVIELWLPWLIVVPSWLIARSIVDHLVVID